MIRLQPVRSIAAISLMVGLVLSCSGTTGGELLKIPFQAGGIDRTSGSEPFTFTAPTGWTVTLTTARIAVGPFYFNISAPPTDAFRGGIVIMEVTAQVVVDPLDPTLHPIALGADGESGHALSVEVGLLTVDKTQSDADDNLLQNGFAFVEGTATKGTVTLPFSGLAIIDQSLVPPQSSLADQQRVKGANTDLQFTSNNQSLTMRIDPTHWFDQTDFSTLKAPPSGGKAMWTEHSTFSDQLLQGLKSSDGVYLFSLSGK